MKPWAVTLGAALVVFYASRPLIGDTAAANLAAIAGVGAMLWSWDRDYSRANKK